MQPTFFSLEKQYIFPHPLLVEGDIVALSTHLFARQLLTAYSFGFFPWYNEEGPVLWWYPDPRCVLFPEDLKVSKSMRQLIRKNAFQVTLNKDFNAVILACKNTPRRGQQGTWIHDEIIEAYLDLHLLKVAHSVEIWQGDELVGGLYGIILGRVFYGESMFSRVSNASKYGFIKWVQHLQSIGITMIDCQQETPHILSLGAKTISKKAFHQLLFQNRLYQLQKGDLYTEGDKIPSS